MYSNELICNILIYISENINSKISIDELQHIFFYNKFYIVKLFKKEIGISIIEYINSIRIYNSILEIKNTNKSLTSIGIRNGFYSLEYFSETFKSITKLNPKVFKDYFSRKKYISTKDLYLINDSIIKLYEISNIKNIYLSKQKSKNIQVKNLSIFK